MSALCTDQSKKKKKKKKKYKVQCLDVYELFDDCVEHDHFYTRRFLIKDHGFALGVCCLLVPVQSSPQEVTWFRFWWLSAPRGGLSTLPLHAGPREGPGQGQKESSAPRWHSVSGLVLSAWGRIGQKGLSPLCLLFP